MRFLLFSGMGPWEVRVAGMIERKSVTRLRLPFFSRSAIYCDRRAELGGPDTLLELTQELIVASGIQILRPRSEPSNFIIRNAFLGHEIDVSVEAVFPPEARSLNAVPVPSLAQTHRPQRRPRSRHDNSVGSKARRFRWFGRSKPRFVPPR